MYEPWPLRTIAVVGSSITGVKPILALIIFNIIKAQTLDVFHIKLGIFNTPVYFTHV
jgi:hypothetical protein